MCEPPPRRRSDLAWEGIVFNVDVHTTPAHLERVATEIVANIKLNPKWYGGDYRSFLTDSAPGFKLELSVFYNHAGCGARPAVASGFALHRRTRARRCGTVHAAFSYSLRLTYRVRRAWCSLCDYNVERLQGWTS